MKRISATPYVVSILAGMALLALVSISTYVGGFFLLADNRGLFPSKELFKAYEPAMRVQHWASDKPVDSGYVDPQGRRYLKRLP